jgi:hypothetical protein
VGSREGALRIAESSTLGSGRIGGKDGWSSFRLPFDYTVANVIGGTVDIGGIDGPPVAAGEGDNSKPSGGVGKPRELLSLRGIRADWSQ